MITNVSQKAYDYDILLSKYYKIEEQNKILKKEIETLKEVVMSKVEEVELKPEYILKYNGKIRWYQWLLKRRIKKMWADKFQFHKDYHKQTEEV